MEIINAHVNIYGIVQGVGFRPFVNRVAISHNILGWVRNTNFGADLEIQGLPGDIEEFIQEIKSGHPAPALVQKIEILPGEENGSFEKFEIIDSRVTGKRSTLISPDMAICPDCLNELFNQNDRRYRYPFINCTNCGPRFTIIKDIPYDRKNTTMSEFEMCSDCEREYTDLYDRRYHAQPDCCPDCGPRMELLGPLGERIEGDPIKEAAEAIRKGAVVAIKGIGGFHLAARADLPAVAVKIRELKSRDERPLALMCRDIKTVRRMVNVSKDEEAVLTSFRRPIVLLEKYVKSDFQHISENDYVGIMLPYTPLHYLLMENLDAVIMTSANKSDLPIVYKNREAIDQLKGIADYFLIHNREIETRCDDSLQWVVDGKDYLVRRSRGFAPFPIATDISGGILACGAEQKASFTVTSEGMAFISQHIGDLKNQETYYFYEEQVRHFERLFGIDVKVMACDLHPDYLSTELAMGRSASDRLELIKIQHHHAHMASCMADNNIENPCIGIIWDGTGYGTDGTIWGGEFLTGDMKSFHRAGSIRPMKLAGGDKAVKEIWRVAIALLEDAGVDSTEYYEGEKSDSIREMLKSGTNCPISTGMGRLFDGVAAILGFKQEVSYEGQGAVLVEAKALKDDKVYGYEINKEDRWIVDTRKIIQGICNDLDEGMNPGIIAMDFINTLEQMAVDMCVRIRTDSGLNDVVISGGCFQNMHLVKNIPNLLRKAGFNVYHHSRVSTNDEGLSLGQAAIADKLRIKKDN